MTGGSIDLVLAAGEERRRLIEAHLPLSRRVALRYTGRGEAQDDLAQAMVKSAGWQKMTTSAAEKLS